MINLTALGLLITLFAVFTAGIGYFLGKRKTETPFLTCIIGFFSALFPPFGLLFLMLLVLKRDLNPKAT